MGFTTPCFIRKNTPELRKKLEELGYIKNSPKWTDDCNIIWAYQYSEEKGFDTPHYVIANAFDIPFDKHSRLCGKFIDCGTNEDLFLALAALMDDIDIHQWFTDGNKWFQCRFLKVGMHYSDKPEILFERWHKATVEELIEHFRGKEE
ncbi:hypothetical protein [Bacteroides finegoldii]|jgi:hypothetical protein|uniref:hypothetical protein n=1 Tax=Bacteroides finegoldii TaxID=338188 RepID=UPI00205A2809|nr:hypothetical protein [Bacteroides finegoldii]DAV79107.1 MAG TPA: hypothetical protein [Caudoviricetes sp.]